MNALRQFSDDTNVTILQNFGFPVVEQDGESEEWLNIPNSPNSDASAGHAHIGMLRSLVARNSSTDAALPASIAMLARWKILRTVTLAHPILQPAPSNGDGCLGDIIHELGRLKDGWSGLGSKAPHRSIVQDIQEANGYIPAQAPAPEVEVDEDEGYVSLRWYIENHNACLTIGLFGSGRMILTVSRVVGDDRGASEYSVHNKNDMRAIFSDPDIYQFFANAVR